MSPRYLIIAPVCLICNSKTGDIKYLEKYAPFKKELYKNRASG